jgi:hypothetical protein
MGVRRTAAKRDENEREIIDALEGVGASVTQLSEKGLPDLLVGFRGETYLIEVKSTKGNLTAHQNEWWLSWRGREPAVARTPHDALRIIGALE